MNDERPDNPPDHRSTTKQAVGEAPSALPFSAGVIAEGRFLYVSGQVAVRDGVVFSGTVEEETEIVLANLAGVLEAAGATLADVVRCGVYLADLDDFGAMNAVYARTFPHPLPARTTIGAGLVGFKVEIDCVAVLPSTG